MFDENHTKQAITDKARGLPFQKRKQLERDIEHITGEMYKRNRELADTNKTLSLLRTIDSLVLESHISVKMVSERITEAIGQATDYPFIGLFTRSTHQENKLSLFGWNLKNPLGDSLTLDLVKPLHLATDNAWFGGPETARLISLESMKHETITGFLNYPSTEIERLLRQTPLKSMYVVKLRVRRRLVGLLVVGFWNPAEQLSQAQTLQLDRLSETIGVALDNKLLFEENQRVLRQLKESNAKLKALDEAKDDFISMASHQLRTPLTSVKGYLSMVIEGDTGKINPTQKQMLTQAFFSSQRMVYMIADLLNVSRLRTGKFIIEPQPVDLAQMVEEEVEQLKETAKTRKLKLRYTKANKFPDLMLDEIKTRQVVMNFIDNALHYTPAGGEIIVKLLNKDQTVELRVEDNGMGVPRSEQAHLFTKFYRAGNARKARPDGTGLGLFMAKKVVIAQGGAVIFESKEGKGSTFGFTLSKAKLRTP